MNLVRVHRALICISGRHGRWSSRTRVWLQYLSHETTARPLYELCVVFAYRIAPFDMTTCSRAEQFLPVSKWLSLLEPFGGICLIIWNHFFTSSLTLWLFESLCCCRFYRDRLVSIACPSQRQSINTEHRACHLIPYFNFQLPTTLQSDLN